MSCRPDALITLAVQGVVRWGGVTGFELSQESAENEDSLKKSGEEEMTVQDNVIIQPAKVADLAEINAIYNHYVTYSTCVWSTLLFSESDRRAWYEERSEKMPVLVAACDGRVIGWAALGSFRAAYTLAGTLEDSVYVHHDFHRGGIGSKLLMRLIETARRQGVRSILANISADQIPSIRLHEKFGFQKAAHLQQVGCKFGRYLDAVYLQLLLVGSAT